MPSLDVLLPDPLVASALPEDRRNLVRYLRDYLASGVGEEPPQLHTSHKQLRIDERREPIGQVSWKWSELSGKYIGCPFWSTEALRVVVGLDERWPGRTPKRVCERVSKGYFLESIQHESVFPRLEWVARLQALVGTASIPSEPDLEALLDRFSVGCVLTRTQVDEVAARPSNADNPWLRFQGTSIRLLPNSAWTEQQRASIREARLLEPC
ncbi:MAG: hypothetical protein FJ294_11605 [Planctomycetes bacterium]|nr:hypothetical protein [Planctomycetota bacterium]